MTDELPVRATGVYIDFSKRRWCDYAVSLTPESDRRVIEAAARHQS
jgi:hypothetical protein